jgi:hypothetical protein
MSNVTYIDSAGLGIFGRRARQRQDSGRIPSFIEFGQQVPRRAPTHEAPDRVQCLRYSSRGDWQLRNEFADCDGLSASSLQQFGVPPLVNAF